METNKNINLSWLCINKYLPKLDINNIKQTLLKSGVTFLISIAWRKVTSRPA